jgi:hypothetical protein
MRPKTLARIAAATAASAFVYRRFLRQPILTWGATAAEAATRLPGDGPSPRGGAYTYDWIENLLGLNMHSADRILPDYQHQQVGDGFGYGANKMSFKIVEPERVLATQSADGNWVWTFVLAEHGGKTRLISRNRFRLPKLKDKIGMIPMEPGSLIMERKMLYGIKQRAERLAAEQKEPTHV